MQTEERGEGGKRPSQHVNRRASFSLIIHVKYLGEIQNFLEYKAPTHNNKQGPHLTKLYKEPAVVKDANVLP